MRLQQKLAYAIVTLMLFGWLTSASADDKDCGSFDVQSAASVPQAVGAIRAVLECQGFKITAVIDHGDAAQRVGLDLRPTQLIIFSDPRADSQLIRARRSAGIDLPQKLLVYQDAGGKVRVHSNAACYVTDRHGIAVFDFAQARVRKTLGQFDADRGLITVESKQTAEATVAALSAAIQAAGFNSRVVDHTMIAADADRFLPPTQLVIFGNPRVGTLLMQNEQTIGIDLPLKILVWQDGRDKRVFMTYNDPQFIARRHNVGDADTLLNGIANTLKNLTTAAAGQ